MIRQCHSVVHVLLLRCVSYFLLFTFKLKRFVCEPPTTLIVRHPFNHATDWLLLCCHSLMCYIVSYHVCNLTIRPTGMSLLCIHIKIALHKNFGQNKCQQRTIGKIADWFDDAGTWEIKKANAMEWTLLRKNPSCGLAVDTSKTMPSAASRMVLALPKTSQRIGSKIK